MRKGIPVSPGIAVGRAYCIDEIFVANPDERVAAEQTQSEVARFHQACQRTADDLDALYLKVAAQFGDEEARIFQTHASIARDHSLHNKVSAWIIGQRSTAPAALHHVLAEYTALFDKTSDVLLRERLGDVRDVIVRISGHLSELLSGSVPQGKEPLILVAAELLPSQVVTLGDRQVEGIITQAGGSTSHAAILARSRGIPAVSGLRGILRHVQNGDTVVVDGRDGAVIVNPDSEVESAYRKLQREFVDLRGKLAANRDLPARTADGQRLQLLANVNHLADAQAAVRMGATGVGLYRTEYLFLTHPTVPDEEEQLAAYRRMIRESPGKQITIRTLDLGGDKTIPFLGHTREANPFMGWRSIRLSFEHPEFFQMQIRAILRAGATARAGAVRVLFPMITTLEEIRRVRGMVRRAHRQLEDQGKLHREVPLGLMLEVPAAAVALEDLLDVVDFVSIGSNDLVQYLMAADRDNPKVSHLCQPLSPAVLRVLSQVIRTCRTAGKPVTLCGEMAGSPRAFVLLVGMGLRSFSMSPAFVPTIKELAGHLSASRAEAILEDALRLKTTGQIQRFMGQQIGRICPNLRLLDSE